MKINTNLSSLIVQSSLKSSTNGLNIAIERMTSGFRINHAKDNAANYSINTKLSTKISAYQVAEENAMMGLDMVQTAESSLSQISDGLSRLRALATQAQNGTYGDKSLDAINAEANSLATEINRIFKTATYNGKKLLDSYKVEIPDDIGCQVDLTPKYNGFIENPIDYSEAEVAAMTSLAGVDETSAISAGQYSISSAEELAKLARMTNSGLITGGEFVLASDIDLSAYSAGAGWTPIGTEANGFQANFNGNGHTITNLRINTNQKFFGLFGRINGADIKNVGLVNCNVNNTGTGWAHAYIGTLVASTEGGTLENCFSTGIVNGSVCVGGLIGATHQTTTTNCYSECNVTGVENVGGLIGNPDGAGNHVVNCFASGTVKGNKNVGGLLGCISSRVENCYASGAVSGNESVGGLVGMGWSSYRIINSHSTGSVNGKLYTGGLVGWRGNAGITSNCYASGNVNGEKYTGSVFGCIELTQGRIQEFINVHGYGEVSGTEAVGSFAGGVCVKKDGTLYGGVSITGCTVINQNNIPLVGNFLELNGSVYSNLDSYDMSAWLAGVSTIYLPPEETTLQVGINSDASSSITFNTTVEYGSFDLLYGLKMEAAGTLELLDSIIKQVNEKQTEIGSIQNRLESVLEQVGIAYENLVSTQSTIRDADISKESSAYIRNQILQQASATLLATANQTPAIALQLL